MIISCGSKKISVKIVDSFCEGKYYSETFNKQDIENIKRIKASYPDTADKLIRPRVVNEKEYKQCESLQAI